MKKIITLLFACLMMTKVFSGPGFTMSYTNFTQGTFIYNFQYTDWMNVMANYGDSIRLEASYQGCGFGQFIVQQWFFNSDSIPNTSGISSYNIIADHLGMYSSVAPTCPFPPLKFYLFLNTTGTGSVKNINFLDVFPTTVTSSITIQLNSIKTNDVEISFFDMNGRQLKTDFYKNIVGEFIKNENTEALAKGIYFLRIKAGDDMIEKKFVKM